MTDSEFGATHNQIISIFAGGADSWHSVPPLALHGHLRFSLKTALVAEIRRPLNRLLTSQQELSK